MKNFSTSKIKELIDVKNDKQEDFNNLNILLKEIVIKLESANTTKSNDLIMNVFKTAQLKSKQIN